MSRRKDSGSEHQRNILKFLEELPGYAMYEGEKVRDNEAKEEQKAFDSGELEGMTDAALANAQERREEGTRVEFHKIFIWGLRLAGFALIILLLVRFWHFVAPGGCYEQAIGLITESPPVQNCWNWKWLSQNELQEIDRILFSGALGALISRYLAPILSNGKGKK